MHLIQMALLIPTDYWRRGDRSLLQSGKMAHSTQWECRSGYFFLLCFPQSIPKGLLGTGFPFRWLKQLEQTARSMGKTDGNYLYARNPDGSEKWRWATPWGNDNISRFIFPVIGADGTIYVGGDGHLYALNSDGTEKWVFHKISGMVGTPVICSEGVLYTGAGDKLYAINVGSMGLAKSSWPMPRHDERHTGRTDRLSTGKLSPSFDDTSTWAVYKDTDNKDTSVITFADGGDRGEKYKVIVRTTNKDQIIYRFKGKVSGYTGCDKSAYHGEWPGYRKIELGSNAGFATMLKMKMLSRSGTGAKNAYVAFYGSGDEGWTQTSGPADACGWLAAYGSDDAFVWDERDDMLTLQTDLSDDSQPMVAMGDDSQTPGWPTSVRPLLEMYSRPVSTILLPGSCTRIQTVKIRILSLLRMLVPLVKSIRSSYEPPPGTRSFTNSQAKVLAIRVATNPPMVVSGRVTERSCWAATRDLRQC